MKKNGKAKSHSNAEAKQRSLANLIPFVKGDPRINRNGRPKCFDELRKLAQSLLHEDATDRKGNKIVDGEGNPITNAEMILRRWFFSFEPSLQKSLIEYAFGKVPDKIEGEITNKKSITLYYDHERNGNGSRVPSEIPSGTN